MWATCQGYPLKLLPMKVDIFFKARKNNMDVIIIRRFNVARMENSAALKMLPQPCTSLLLLCLNKISN